MPEYDRECGSRRVFDFVEFLREDRWTVTYIAREGETDDRYARMLAQCGVRTHVGFETLSDEFLAERKFDLALLEYWHVAEGCIPALRRWSPGTRILIDSHDVHFLRNSRASFRSGAEHDTPKRLNARIGDEFIRELNTYAAADGVLAVSDKEAGIIADLVGDPVCRVPLCEDLPASRVPFHERKGILFVGNFWHQPNVDAAAYLVNDIVPHLPAAVLAQHPLWVVGNASEAKAATLAKHPYVRVVGWVPSLVPYFSRTRVTAVPVRYGAGTKGKVIQSMAAGTPVVTTSIGVEGLELAHDRDVLVADDPVAFAAALEDLLTNEARWTRLAERGPEQLVQIHGRAAVKQRFFAAIDAALDRSPKVLPDGEVGPETSYEQVRTRTIDAIQRSIPAGSSVAIISKGDERLVLIEGRHAQHFPQLPDGRYAGFYPADGAAAVATLEAARMRGVEYFVVPSTAAWWLAHYKQLAEHLDDRATLVLRDHACAIYKLTPSGAVRRNRAVISSTPRARSSRPRVTYDVEKHRPAIDPRVAVRRPGRRKPRVLVLGIYLPTQLHNAIDESRILRAATTCTVTQRWIALGGKTAIDLADVTAASINEPTPKFELLNRLIAANDIDAYDYLVIVDDDIVMPERFLDAFIDLQQRARFALAQPARTNDSYYDHPIVAQQRGVLARQTMFVEIGPVTSIHRSLFDAILPFDLTSAMGWGYENVWSYRVRERGLRMGIIDAVPVSHSLRKPVANYSWDIANQDRHALLAKHPHLPLDQCFRVLDVIGFKEAHRV